MLNNQRSGVRRQRATVLSADHSILLPVASPCHEHGQHMHGELYTARIFSPDFQLFFVSIVIYSGAEDAATDLSAVVAAALRATVFLTPVDLITANKWL